jgi:transcriptional regulator with XRE-family HTH domain
MSVMAIASQEAPGIVTMPMVTGAQIRAARVALRLDQRDVARLANVALSTLVKCETAEGVPEVSIRTLVKITRTLSELGGEFICHNGAIGIVWRRDGG